ncbi:MAG: hypothetical protein JSV93_04200 [Candidatus Omnitrophota bacterium]|nr:MAG: hypothetical protein JSV93_04200 [Candidatus Omnitrophota bacterium]
MAILLVATPLLAEDRTWSGGGDGTSWSDKENWFPEEVPTLEGDVTIDDEDASPVCDETFSAKSIIIGGQETSRLTVEKFIYGQIKPSSTSDTAISNRKGGTLLLKGAGIITVHGKYEDSEPALTSEPSFLFWIE